MVRKGEIVEEYRKESGENTPLSENENYHSSIGSEEEGYDMIMYQDGTVVRYRGRETGREWRSVQSDLEGEINS